jgi:small subunit ribosomal protein S16
MSLVMRMRQGGRKNKRVFRIVVADPRSPRDGKYLDGVGSYDPYAKETTVIDRAKVEKWLKDGVRPSEKVLILLKKVCPETLEILKKGKR